MSVFKGLDNYMLEKLKKMDEKTVDLMNCFFNQLNKPVCLVAHNGNNFDYPILKRQLRQMVKHEIEHSIIYLNEKNF